ncbi:non-ribosomal peptide synthetase [Streptomyces fuscigenes]|uniref:non-ribosomal peptide synthetase n=1 Tax=Streptomyces fuscigenes TaxID=1528880 RepID=UPI001F492B6A|nr:non-ribosomal peptide synthetase [Streptomyces fuscigenes]MCF3960124.1 amino acid adenylation domain-containing protein [Streptomyces fuscigenes]
MSDAHVTNKVQILPLTAAQSGLWFAQRIDPGNPSYNIAEYADIRGDLDFSCLERAVRHAEREMEALRVTFEEREGVPFQRVHPPGRLRIALVDLRRHEQPADEAARRMQRDLTQAADVTRGPLVRLTLYRLSRERHLFHQQVHHLALDGYGAALALARIAEIYSLLACSSGAPAPFVPAPLSPLLREERAYEETERAGDARFWADHLADAPPATGLADATAPLGHGTIVSGRGASHLPVEALRAAAKEMRVAWPTLFMAAMGVYLHRARGLGEVVLGLPVTGRRTKTARTTPGMLSNIVPLRFSVSPSDTVAEVTRRASAQAKLVLRHQRYPAEQMRRDHRLTGSPRRLVGPSVNVLAFDDALRFGAALATLHNLSIGPVEDLALAVHASFADGELGIELLGNPRLHDAGELDAHRNRFADLVKEFAGDPRRVIGSLSLLRSQERAHVLSLSPGPAPVAGTPTTLLEEFARRVAAAPEETAVVAEDSRLGFAELDARADALASELSRHGARAGTRVGVALPRSVDLVVAMLAVLRTGAAYLPLDSSYPADRLAWMLEDARPVALIATPDTRRRVDPQGTVTLVAPDAHGQSADRAAAPVRPPGPHDAAYVIYTSGSTGRPKAVVVEHRSLANLLTHHRREFHAPAQDMLGRRARVALTAATSFDASWDPVLWMIAGHELHIVSDTTRRDPEALVRHLVAQRIDVVESTPTYVRQLMRAGLLTSAAHRPRVIALGGEPVDSALWEELAAHSNLLVFNFYGPTETTVDTVTARIVRGTQPVIGRPVAGARAYVLDSALHPMPPGTAGELYLSGEGVARGYAGRSDLTAERFLPDPFGPPGTRMYRTGDLARWSDVGALEFLGRSDRQVKVRGYRVETGEVESALGSLPEIAEAAVTLVTGHDGPQRLTAWLVARPGHEVPDLVGVRDALASRMPEHMVPSAYAVVDALPLTSNGKLDTGRLPAAAPLTASGAAARTPEEERMCALFADVLGVPGTGRDDDFFLLGGHSLLATRLIGRIRAVFGVEVPVAALFEARTPAALVAALATAAPARPAIEAMARPERVPLSFAQQRLWLVERMGDGGAAYHLPVALRLTGEIDTSALSHALDDVVRRHEALRTLIVEDEDGAHQRVLPADTVGVVLHHRLRGEQGVRPDASPFALDRDLPLRAELFATGPDEHTLVLTLHHIAADGWSMAPMMSDLSTAYAARLSGRAPDWRPLPLQYADYTLWQREFLGDSADPSSLAGQQLAHFTATLHDLPAEATLPADRPRPARSSGRGGTVPVRLSASTHRALADLARSLDATPFMVLHAALAALMSRLGTGEDVPVGTPVAGRADEQLTGLVGFFVNTLVLRTDTSGAPAFRDLVRRVRHHDLAAYAHQDLPFDRLVEELAPGRRAGRHPLFQVMLSLNNVPAPTPALPGLAVVHDPSVGRGGAKFDLTWDFTEKHDAGNDPGGIVGELEYSQDLYDRSTAERFAEHFTLLLDALLDDPERPFTDVEFLTPEQRAAALDEAAGPTALSPGRTVLDAFAAQAASSPQRTAVVSAAEKSTFTDLQGRAEEVARLLADRGVARGDRVAVALPRTSWAVAALLGTWRAGAVYVPLDPSHPAARNRMILDTAAPRLLLTTPELAPALPDSVDALFLDDAGRPSVSSGGRLPEPPAPGEAAYVLYTSGSTGRPKGVVVEHGALANLLASHQERLLGPAEAANNGLPLRVALSAALTFDASFDPLLWMVAGHELHLLDDAVRIDAEALTAHLHEHGIDVLETTPSFLEQLRAAGLFAPGRPWPRVVALGGEAVDETLWNELSDLPGVAVWNLYGPTEATVDSVMGRLLPGTRPHLGQSVAGIRARVLDTRLRPAAPGTTGELYLSGPGLARGYDRRPGASAERFLPDPYGPPGSRMYRTGDLVRRAQGRLVYAGRSDGQVKVRGFRIETAEVTAALGAHPAVARAAATVRPGPDGTGRLIAWIVPRDGRETPSADIRAYAADRLPRYMVPSAVIPVAELPLTVHGKTDFDALPDASPDDAAAPKEAPRSAREEILCALFADSLGHQDVGRADDFFDLGGHSLMATRLVGRIRAAFGVELPVRALFEAGTPAALAARLDEAATARPALRPALRPEHPPLSPAQHRLWFLHRLDPGNAAYHIPIAVHLDGQLDHAALRAALSDLVARHESLRTVIKEHDGAPYQAVLDTGDARPALPLTPIREDSLETGLAVSATRAFDLVHEIPLRAELFELGDDRHVLLVTVHHIAADGWSMGPLAQDLAGAYSARVAGRSPSWPRLPVQYTDYTLWQRDLLGSTDRPDSAVSGQLTHWKDQMAGAPQETALPTDRPRSHVSGRRGGSVPLHLPATTVEPLTALARACSASVFMVLHTAVAALLHRVGGDDDITIGTPVAGRTDEALDGLVGFFVNTLPLRTDLAGDPSFRQLLARVRESDLSAYAHQDLPFERLVEELQPARSLSRHPLFQVMLSLNNTPPPRLELPGLHARLAPVETGGAKFDLSFGFTQVGSDRGGAGLDGTLEFDRDLFDAETAQRLAGLLALLLRQAVADPDLPISELRTTDATEEAALLAQGDGGTSQEPARTILDHFADTVAASRSGDIAVTAPDGRLSFAELDERSGKVAALLATAGVRRGDTVAVLLPRSTGSLAALLGVLKAGAVYAPLERSLPDARIAAVLDDASPALVIADEASTPRLPGSRPVLVLDEDALPAGPDTVSSARPPRPIDPAYLIHTSGSTGTPKGVLVGHASLARLFEHHRTHLYAPAARTAGRDRLNVTLTASLSFDASLDPVLWMIAGHTLHIIDDLTRRDPEALVQTVRTERLDVLESTPTHVAQLLDAGLLAPGAHTPSVLALGGEAVPATLWSRLRAAPGTVSWNLYGPTEATVDTLVTPLAAADRPVLGPPVTGTRAYLLDTALRPVPAGVAGDLYLAGDSLAFGYLNRPGETARSFLPDPFRPGGGRMYRTGDRARRASDGALLFAGRGDTQVKIRGFRVEPDEVAAVLETCTAVARAVVVPQDTGTGPRLAAYLVPADPPGDTLPPEAEAILEAAREHVTDALPEYMLPTAWAVVGDIPLTPSGKLDRHALPEPTASVRTGTGRTSPRTPREDVLCTLFAETLGIEKVTIDDDFFALGGHSLLATRLIGRVRAVLGVDVSIRSIFEAPTVARLAARLADGADDDPLATLLPLRTTGERPPLFCVHPATGLAWTYGGLLPHLDADQPVYGLQVPNLDGTSPLPDTLSALAARYVSELRSVQPHGPYHLLGWSFGGNIVHEVAVQLQEAGERVALLTILDAFPVAPRDDLDRADRDTMFRALLANLGLEGDLLTDPQPLDITHVRDHFRAIGSPMGSLEPATLEAMVDSFIAQARLMRSFTPRPFHGPVLFFTATEGRPADQFPLSLWDPYITGHIENHDVPFAHARMFQPAARAQIGPTVAAALRSLHRTTQGDPS